MSESSQKKARKRVDELKGRKRRSEPQQHEITLKNEGTRQHLPEIEVELERLPSRGVPYPKGSRISYNTYTFGEVKKASVSNMGIPQSIKLALAGIKTEGFDKQQLTLIDCLYLGIMRKVSSMGGMEFEIPFACHHCGQRTKGRFKHTDIEFGDLSEEVTELPIVAEIKGEEFHFSPMTAKQYLDLHTGRYQKVLKEGKPDSVSIYAAQVKNFDFEESYNTFYSLTDKDDIEVLEMVDEMLYHEIKPPVATCTSPDPDNPEEKCGAKNLVKLEGREALLLPFRQRGETIRNRIRIGTTSQSECVQD